MKPNFALNFTDTGIALLHRTARGWLKVGETPFDAADLDDALDYMRKTALGLEPGGFTTKLVIPASQILYTEVPVSGGDAAATRREIAARLEERTPYKADEIAFDWSGSGAPTAAGTVAVAAVARDTLAEAEGFAVTHKFSPLGFVALPEEGQFSGEPWFGEAQGAAALLPAGETVERDSEAITLLDENARAARRKAKAARQAAEAAEAEAAASAATAAAGDAPAAPPAAEAQSDLFSPPANEAPVSPAEEAPAAVAPGLQAGPAAARHQDPEFDSPAPLAGGAARAAGPAVTITEITPLQSPPAASAAAPAPTTPAALPATGPNPTITSVIASPAPAAAPVALTAGFSAADPAIPAPPRAPGLAARAESGTLTAAAGAPRQAEASPAASEPGEEEAPFAHVPDSASFPDADEELDLPPLPQLARRGGNLAGTGVSGTGVTGNVIGDLPEDDLPPAPSGAVMAAYHRGRSSEEGRPAPASQAAVSAPALQAARGAAAATPAPAQNGPRPGAASRDAAAPATAGGKAAVARGLGALVTAPSIPGTRKARAKPAAPAEAAATGNPRDAARSLSNSPFAGPRQRGKPRYLGLILIAILLLCLALVAAWSSFFLASRGDRADEVVQVADAEAGSAIDDEMLADGQDPEALADGGSGAEPVAEANGEAAGLSEPDPASSVSSESPAAVALLDAEDEIFLSGADAPPPAFDALSLPTPEGSAEAAPGAPMPPPPFGTVYRFDENNLLIPTAEGLPAPGGFMLYAGKPPKVPPARSAVAEAAARAASAAAEAAPLPESAATGGATAGEATTEGAAAPDAAPAGAAGNPSLVATDQGGSATAPENPGTDPTAIAAGAGPEAQPDPELADRRPRSRPDGINPGDDAALETEAATDTAASEPGLRPRARPRSVEAAFETARSETAAASLAAPEAEILQASASAAASGLSAADAANPSLLTISRRPAAKPNDFSRAVEAAVAAAVRAPEPEPEAAPVAVAAAAPAPAPKASGKAAVKPDEQDEIDEPPVAASAAPKIPTKASVAKQATFTKAINLSKVNLIGVYGTQSNRYALVRLANGKYRKVSIGDKIDGGQVKAITANEVRYQKGGRLIALAMPKG